MDTNDVGPGGTLALSLTTTKSNDLIVVFGAGDWFASGNACPPSGVTSSSPSLTFTKHLSGQDAEDGIGAADYTAVASTPVSGMTIDISFSTSCTAYAFVGLAFAISDARTSSPFDGAGAVASGYDSVYPPAPPITMSAETTTDPNDMLLGLVAVNYDESCGGLPSIGSGFTSTAGAEDEYCIAGAEAERNVTGSAGTYTPAFGNGVFLDTWVGFSEAIVEALTADAPTPSSVTIDQGQASFTLTSHASGGTPAYTYKWYSASSSAGACSSGTVVSGATGAVYTSSGAPPSSPTYYCYTVTDSTSTVADSAWSEVTVDSALTAPSTPTTSATSLDVNQVETLTSTTPNDGTPPYAWQWYVSTDGGSYVESTLCATNSGTGAAVSTTETCSIAANKLTVGDTYAFYMQVTDSATTPNAINSLISSTITVSSALTAPAAPTVGHPKEDVDQATQVTATLQSTGTASYSWVWTVAIDGGSYGSAAAVCSVASGAGASGGALETCAIPANTLAAGDSYTFEITVTDSATSAEMVTSVASSAMVAKSPLTAPGAPTPSATLLDFDQPLNVVGTIPSSGTPTYSWTWLYKIGSGSYAGTNFCTTNSGGGAVAGATETCAVAGSSLTIGDVYTFELEVTDSATAQETQGSAASVTVTVNSATQPPSTPSPSATALDEDQTFDVFANTGSGGTSPFSWQWLFSTNGGGSYADTTFCSQNSGSTSTVAIADCSVASDALVAGDTYLFELQKTDSASTPEVVRSAATSAIVVSPALVASSTPTVSSTALDVDQTLTVQSTLTATGSPPLAWEWWVSVEGGSYSPSTLCVTNSGTGAADGATETCTVAGNTLTVGDTYTFQLQVTDSASSPETETSNPSTTVTVASALTAPTQPTNTALYLDSNQPFMTVADLPSTGTPDYAWQWMASEDGGPYAATSLCDVSSGSGALGGAQETCSIEGGNLVGGNFYTFELQATDSATLPETEASAPSAPVHVSTPLTAPATPTPSATSLDVDQSYTVSATLLGTGTSSYSWTWLESIDGGTFGAASDCGATSSGSGALAGDVETCSVPGNTLVIGDTYAFEVQVTDSADLPESQTSATSATTTVFPALTTPSVPTVSAINLDSDQSYSVSSTLPSTGTATYAWNWLESINGGGFLASTDCGASASGSGAVGGATETCSIAGSTLLPGETYAWELQITDSASSSETQSSLTSPTTTVYSPLSASTTPIPSAAVLDADQVLTATSTLPSTGTPTYSWLWLVSVNGGLFATTTLCAVNGGNGGTASTVETCTIAANTLVSGDTYAFELQVSDSADVPELQVSGPSSTVLVNAALVAGAITPASPSIDRGQSVLLVSAATGGTPVDSYQWYTGASCSLIISGATGPSYLASPTSTTSYSYQVMDGASSPDLKCSAADTVTVNAALASGAVTLATPSIDVGQSDVLTAHPTGGTPALSYQWYSGSSTNCGSDTAIASATASSYTASPSATTYYCYSVTDSALNSVTVSSFTVSVQVFPALLVGTPKASAPTVDFSQSVTFLVVATAGSGGYSYLWTGLPKGCFPPSGPALNCVPAQNGTYSITVAVTDSNGATVTSAALAFTVFADPTVSAPSASVASADVGQSMTFTTTAALGTLTYVGYAWSASAGLGCTGSSIATLSCTATAAGSYTISVSVTDSDGFTSAVAATAFTVYADPTLQTPTASSASVDFSQSVTFSVAATYGSGSATLAWSGLPNGCASSNAASITCTPAKNGTYNITVSIADSNRVSLTSPTLTFAVFADPTASTPSPSVGQVDVGQQVMFTTSASAGTWTYASYAWSYGAGLGCAASTTGTLTCTAATAGTFQVSVAVMDSNGFSSAPATLSYTVYAAPTVTTPTATLLTTAEVGVSMTFSVATGGGFGSLSLTWTGLPAGCSGSMASITCKPAAAGEVSVSATVKDADGVSAVSAPLVLTVAPALGAPTIGASTSLVTVGSSVVLFATVNGGVAPYTYLWTGLPTGCANSNLVSIVCTPTASGTFSVSVAVTDVNGAAASSASETITVNAKAAAPSILSGSSGSAIGGLAVVVVLLAVLLLVALLRGRKKGEAVSASAPTSSPPPEEKPAQDPESPSEEIPSNGSTGDEDKSAASWEELGDDKSVPDASPKVPENDYSEDSPGKA